MRQARTTATPEQRAETMSGTRTSRAGFGTFDRAVRALNNTTFQVGDDSEVIIFLDPENFTYALRHWVKYQDPENPRNQITRVEFCLEDDCPLCDVGDKAKATAYFNVVNLATPNKVIVWEATPDPTGAIQKEFNKLQKLGKSLNDSNLYWVISKEKGRNGFYSYSVDKVTEDELTTQWPRLSPVSAAQREALSARAYGDEYIQYKTREEIQEFVDSIPTAPGE